MDELSGTASAQHGLRLRNATVADLDELVRLHVQTLSNGFYERLGAERLLAASGEFHGGYGWRDLEELLERCSA